MQNQESKLHQIQHRFHEYKTGINLELTTLIREVKKDGLQKIKDQVYNALRDPLLQGYVNTDFVQDDSNSQKQIFATEPSTKELSEDAWDNFLLKNKEIIKLFSALKKQRILYKMKEMQIIDKYENELKKVLETNSSNDELQKRIHELSDKVDSLKDEVIQNKRVITVMDNQNQILKRDLQKLRNDKIKTMKEREKGILNIENYYSKLDVTRKSNSPPKNGNTLPDMGKSTVMIQDYTKTAPVLQSQTQLKTPVVTESLANLNRSASSMRPMTATTTAAHRPITAKTYFERNTKYDSSQSKSLKRFSSASKSTVIQVKYKIRKQQQI